MTKAFSWSWSKLKNFRSCPKRHYEIDLAKNVREADSPALLWGNEVHSAMANHVAKGVKLPPEMMRYEGWPSRARAVKEAGIDVEVENKMAIGRDFKPCGFFAPETWFRSVIDVKMLLPDIHAALTIDWKTGNSVSPEFEQLALSAQVLFSHYPWLEEIASIYVWFGHDTQTVKVYRRGDMTELWAKLMPEINQMAEAHRTSTYPPKPSGLCKRYCPVTSCIYHGKGSF